MLSAFVATEGRLELRPEGRAALSDENLVWLDICEATDEEADALRAALGLTFERLEAAQNMEVSARFYVDEAEAIHLRADFLSDAADGPENAAVKFVIRGNTLFSFHHTDLPTFKSLRERSSTNLTPCAGPKDVLLEIYATDIEYCADLLEGVHRQLRGASKTVLMRTMNCGSSTTGRPKPRRRSGATSIRSTPTPRSSSTRSTSSWMRRSVSSASPRTT